MIDHPKYKKGQVVKFKIGNNIKEGFIFIIDRYGIFEDGSDVYYDILVGKENCLYKHIREDMIF